MQLIKYNPFHELQKMEQDMGRLWENSWNMFPALADTSAMDLYEENGNLVADVSLPNFKKDEINVTADEGVLEISAEHKEEEEKKSKRRYFFHESRNQYFRRVTLPEGAQADKVDASFKDGTLKVTMPMATPSRKAMSVTIK